MGCPFPSRGTPAPQLSAATHARIRERLHTIRASSLARKASKRHKLHRFHGPITPDLIGQLLLTGPSVSDQLTLPGSVITPRLDRSLYGYPRDPAIAVDDLAAVHGLHRRTEAEVYLYAPVPTPLLETISPVFIAADLAVNHDDVYRQVGLEALTLLQEQWLATQPRPGRRSSST